MRSIAELCSPDVNSPAINLVIHPLFQTFSSSLAKVQGQVTFLLIFQKSLVVALFL